MYCYFWKLLNWVCFIDVIIRNIEIQNQIKQTNYVQAKKYLKSKNIKQSSIISSNSPKQEETVTPIISIFKIIKVTHSSHLPFLHKIHLLNFNRNPTFQIDSQVIISQILKPHFSHPLFLESILLLDRSHVLTTRLSICFRNSVGFLRIRSTTHSQINLINF